MVMRFVSRSLKTPLIPYPRAGLYIGNTNVLTTVSYCRLKYKETGFLLP